MNKCKIKTHDGEWRELVFEDMGLSGDGKFYQTKFLYAGMTKISRAPRDEVLNYKQSVAEWRTRYDNRMLFDMGLDPSTIQFED